jgi:O-antigen ligase
VTALIVARPLLRGEDPGLLSDLSDPGGMTLTLLGFAGCTAWAAWRLWSGHLAVRIGWVEVCLLLVTAAFFLDVRAASYERAAWMTAWEWLGLAATLFLVRQLAVRPEEQQGLLAVVLATGAALAAQGVYQAVYELPAAARAEAARPTGERLGDSVREDLEKRGFIVTPLEVQQLRQRLESRRVYGPFFHPASFAGCLALLLPPLAGAVLVARRRSSGLFWATAVPALLAIAALVLTGCWSAVVAVGLVGLLALGLRWPAHLGGVKVGLGVAALLAVGGVWLLLATGALAADVERCREVWPATWQLIEERPGRGYSGAQFRYFYPRVMAETAGAQQTAPGNALLELWVEGGFAALGAFVVGVAALFAAVLRGRRHAEEAPAPPLEPRPGEEQRAGAGGAAAGDDAGPLRWEYYLGGTIGMIVAFVLRASASQPDEILPEAIAAALRCVVWFAAVAVFESVPWTRLERGGVLALGAAALLLVWLVYPGVSYPAVAGLFWVVVALALAVAEPEPVGWLSRLRVTTVLPVPVLVAGTFCYFAFVFYPASASAAADLRARYLGSYVLHQRETKPEERKLRPEQATGFIRERILNPLLKAEKEDPGNVRLRVQLAGWFGQVALQTPLERRRQDDDRRAVAWATLAQEANREGPEGYLVEYDLFTRFAGKYLHYAGELEKEAKDKKAKITQPMRKRNETVAEGLRGKARESYHSAAETLRAYLKRDPTDPTLRYYLAAALRGEGKTELAADVAREALRLDDRVKPPRNLTISQREQLLGWLGKESAR